MKNVTLAFRDASCELPEKSGQYIVLACGFMTFVQYSNKHKKFNCRDEYEDANLAIDIVYWAEVPEEIKKMEVAAYERGCESF